MTHGSYLSNYSLGRSPKEIWSPPKIGGQSAPKDSVLSLDNLKEMLTDLSYQVFDMQINVDQLYGTVNGLREDLKVVSDTRRKSGSKPSDDVDHDNKLDFYIPVVNQLKDVTERLTILERLSMSESNPPVKIVSKSDSNSPRSPFIGTKIADVTKNMTSVGSPRIRTECSSGHGIGDIERNTTEKIRALEDRIEKVVKSEIGNINHALGCLVRIQKHLNLRLQSPIFNQSVVRSSRSVPKPLIPNNRNNKIVGGMDRIGGVYGSPIGNRFYRNSRLPLNGKESSKIKEFQNSHCKYGERMASNIGPKCPQVNTNQNSKDKVCSPRTPSYEESISSDKNNEEKSGSMARKLIEEVETELRRLKAEEVRFERNYRKITPRKKVEK